MSDEEAKPGVYLDKAKHELIVCTDYSPGISNGTILNLVTMNTSLKLFDNDTLDTNNDYVALSSFEDLVQECNNNLENPLRVAKRPIRVPASRPARRPALKPATLPTPTPPPLITGPAKYDAFWHEATQTLIYATAYYSTTDTCKWCTVRLQPDGRVDATANDVPIDVYTSFAARPSPFQNYDQSAIVQQLYYGHKPLRVYLEAMFKGDVPPVAPPGPPPGSPPVAPSGPPPGTPPAADPNVAIAFFFNAFTSQNSTMTDAEFGRYQRFVCAAHDHQDVRRSAGSQTKTLTEVMQWHDRNGGTTDRLPKMMKQFMKEWKTFLQVEDPGSDEDEAKERGEDESESSHDPAADASEDESENVKRLVLYLKQTLGQGFDLDDTQKDIDKDLDLNDITQFCRCIVQCLDNKKLLTILWQRPRDMTTLTKLLRDLNPKNTPENSDKAQDDDMPTAKQKFMFEQIVQENYDNITQEALDKDPGIDDSQSVEEYINERYAHDHKMRRDHADAVFTVLDVINLARANAVKMGEKELSTAAFMCQLLYRDIEDAARTLNTFKKMLNELLDIVSVINRVNNNDITVSETDKFTVYFRFCNHTADEVKVLTSQLTDKKFYDKDVIALYSGVERLDLNLGLDLEQCNLTFQKLQDVFTSCSTDSNKPWSEDDVQQYKELVQHAEEDYPESWNEAVTNNNVLVQIFTELYFDAEFSKHLQSDIKNIKNHFALPPFKQYVFSTFTHGDEDKDTLSADQFKAMADYAELRSKTISSTSQSVNRETFDTLVVTADRNLQDGWFTLVYNVNSIETIFQHYVQRDQEYMSIERFNEFRAQLGLDPIEDDNFLVFITQNKLHKDYYDSNLQHMSFNGFREFVFKVVDLEALERLQLYVEL